MQTIDYTAASVMPHSENHNIALCFIGAVANMKKGQLVYLSAANTVSPVTAATQRPIGIVVAGNREIGTDVTIQTQFQAVINGVAAGAIAALGAQVACTVSTGAAPSFKVATLATDTVVGVALNTALDTAAVSVGILKTFYPLPV
jgi:hypothetical protein